MERGEIKEVCCEGCKARLFTNQYWDDTHSDVGTDINVDTMEIKGLMVKFDCCCESATTTLKFACKNCGKTGEIDISSGGQSTDVSVDIEYSK